MGWSSANRIFDPVARALIDAGVDDTTKRNVLGTMIGNLQDGDWDTGDESLEDFLDDPAIVSAFADHNVHLHDRRCCPRELGDSPREASDQPAPASARDELLQLMASWMLTTGRGSRGHADRILNRHAHELAEQLRKSHNEMRPYSHMGLPCKPEWQCGVAALIDTIDPELKR